MITNLKGVKTGRQDVQSPQPEKSKPPVKMEQRGRILGIGGVFFKSVFHCTDSIGFL